MVDKHKSTEKGERNVVNVFRNSLTHENKRRHKLIGFVSVKMRVPTPTKANKHITQDIRTRSMPWPAATDIWNKSQKCLRNKGHARSPDIYCLSTLLTVLDKLFRPQYKISGTLSLLFERTTSTEFIISLTPLVYLGFTAFVSNVFMSHSFSSKWCD